MKEKSFVDAVKEIIMKVLEKQGLLRYEWHYGVVSAVNGNKLDVNIDGSLIVTPSIPSNPDITFTAGDHVFVHYVNRNPNNLFVPYKRVVG